MALQVYTASLLKEGLVAYLCMDDGDAYWSTDLGKAETVDLSNIDALKGEAERSEKENVIVAPYAIDVEISGSTITPLTKREQIRAFGPTITIPLSYSSVAASKDLHAA